MRFVVSIPAILFAALHILAAATQFKSKDPAARGSAIMMACGGLVAASAALVRLAGVGAGTAAGWITALALLAGCALTCAAAYLNGKQSRDFHLSHHVIRGGVSALLVVGFAIW